MIMVNPYQQYKQNQVQTASQGALVLMVYDAVLKNIRQAKNAVEKKDYILSNKLMLKAQDLISELIISLNFEAGEISKRLYILYEYSNYRLIQANIRKDPAMLDEVHEIIDNLRSAWDGIVTR